MHKRDVLVAWAFVIGLWFAIIFVAIATWNLAPDLSLIHISEPTRPY